MSKFSLVGAESKLVKLGTLEPMKGPRLDAARRASLQSRSELADAFAANVRPIIKRYRRTASPVCGIARALAARGVKTARGGDWSDVQVACDPAALGGLARTAGRLRNVAFWSSGVAVLPKAAPLDVGGLGADNRDPFRTGEMGPANRAA